MRGSLLENKRGSAGWSDDTARYSRILNAVPVNIALVDETGTIRAANDAWKQCAFETPLQSARHVEGIDYLAICDAAARQELSKAAAIASGLRRVLVGEQTTYATEYAAQVSGRQRWFRFMASPLRDDDHCGAIIAQVDVTDRKQAELERDQLFEQSMSLLCIVGFDGFMRRCNPAIENMLGYAHEEIMALPLAELVHPADHGQMARMAAQLQLGQRVSNVETRIRTKNGRYKWVLWDAVPWVEQQIYFAYGQDITARKMAEQQLLESHRRFQLLASATQEAVWDWDLRDNRIWQNEAYLQLFGTFNPAVETVVEWWRRRLHPDDRERVLASVPRSAVDGQQKWILEYRLRRADGHYAHVYDRGFVIFDDQGEPVRMVGSLIDITELKDTEQKLRESEERFRLAVKATRDAIWDWNRPTGYVWRSSGFQTLFGYQPDEIVPDFQWWVDRLHPDDREQILSQVPSAEPGGSQQCAFEYRFRRADGTYANVFDRGFVMMGADGKPDRMVGSMMDVSERRRAEEMAHMHQVELAHISRVTTMGEIATGIAHELNQPLTAIANYAESCVQAIAAGGPRADDKLLEWIEKIATNTHRAAEMIRRLRTFTRKSEPRRSTVELRDLLDEVVELVEPETRLRDMRLRLESNGELHATVDRIQIQQVLVNLLRNAYDAMAANPPDERQVVIAVHLHDDKAEISVEDAGEGIAPENLYRVFDAFFTSKPQGVGIGLAISRSIVEDHGGRLWVQPNATRGVTFRFTLPLSGA
jgi:PAS domain S-box-containing protein